ncbi:hypothetical protein ACH5RR_012702 [Cinchona calisaya]|uniref:MADS-box domain-containing protein n=1 Tax=Cinchona calisaya TaxID=153742 RepID=A0ABD3A8D1_9GENT
MELALLCDIPVCMVIMGPNGEIETWPENHSEVKSVLDKYFEKEEVGPKKELPPIKSRSGETDADILKSLETEIAAMKARIEVLKRVEDVADIENPVEIPDFLDLYQDENPSLTELPREALDSQSVGDFPNGRFVGCEEDEISADFGDWDRMCGEWNEIFADFGVWN